jgi:hypothetical protein
MLRQWAKFWIVWMLMIVFTSSVAVAGDKTTGEEPDRPWIIKRQSPQPSATPKSPPVQEALPWKSDEQEQACRQMMDALDDSYRQAQYSSLQGDSCRTAEHASRFLGLVDQCRARCPEGFLDQNGLKAEIIRNLSVLKQLGEERCPPKK